MDQQQEKASKALGQAVGGVVQSGLYGVAEATQARAFVNGEMTSFMVVVFAQTPEAVAAIKERALTATPHERTEHRGMAMLENMLKQQPGGKPFVFDHGSTGHSFVIGSTRKGMSPVNTDDGQGL